MRAILTLMAGQQVPTFETEYFYFEREDLLYAEQGNHRLLAYVLVGEPTISGLTWYQETQAIDPNLNKTLRHLESLWAIANWNPDSAFAQLPSYLVIPMSPSDQRDNAIERVRAFASEANLNDYAIIAAYLNYQFIKNRVVSSSFRGGWGMKVLIRKTSLPDGLKRAAEIV